MGNEISSGAVAPIEPEVTFSGSSCAGLVYGLASMQGNREYMEDSYVAIESLNSTSLINTSLFAVFDGHGSNFCARYASQVILRVLQSMDEFRAYEQLETQSERDDPSIGLSLLIQALRNTFLQIDKELLSGNVDKGGCTAVVVVVTPAHIVSANAGDSRAVLGRKKCRKNDRRKESSDEEPTEQAENRFRHKALALSFDHKPNNKKEAARIKKAGGFVRGGRVNGKLGVSRSLGDFNFKKCCPYDPSNDIVTALPEFVIMKRNDVVDEFIVLGSDGIWDIVTNAKCGEMVYNSLRHKGGNPMTACQELLKKCYYGGSNDNMTVIILKMPGLKQSKLSQQSSIVTVEQNETSVIYEIQT